MNRLATFIAALLAMVAQARIAAAQETVQLRGRCVSQVTGEPLPFAAVRVRQTGAAVLSDLDGVFRFGGTPGETYTLEIHCLNYAERVADVTPAAGQVFDIVLAPQTYALEEVKVMADYDPARGSAAVIGQQALELIQPTSAADIFTLMPGGLFSQPDATKFNRLNLRQSGQDDNTALGMAVVVDGVAMDNDGFRSQINAMADDDEYADRLGLNRGVNLATISMDHVQSVEVVKGVSSAKWGNLSSGVLSMRSKVGQTPLRVRLKADPLTKLAYVGKGFRLPGRAGHLHLGADVTSVWEDRRDPLSKFTRATGQAAWSSTLSLRGGRNLFLFARLSETFTLNRAKEDELTEERGERFEERYSRTTLAVKAQATGVARAVESVELTASADYTRDLLLRRRYVQLPIPQPSPVALDEGEHEAIFLPATYYSDFEIENMPLTLMARLDAESVVGRGTLRVALSYGLEARRTKNLGRGVLVDMTRPPYPDNSEYVRPTRNDKIPALSRGAAYAEARLMLRADLLDVTLSAGGRGTGLLGLSARYVDLRRPMVEPRLNAAVATNIGTRRGRELRLLLCGGYGHERKMPTLDFIYPDPVYKDYTMLSAYYAADDPNNRILTDTRVFDVTNFRLRPNRNVKAEVGLDAEMAGFSLSVTVFRERTEDGFGKSVSYTPVSYKRYQTPANGDVITGRRPEKTDYVEEDYETFASMQVVRNNTSVIKRGLEYRLTVPRLPALCTGIEVSGALYVSDYGFTEPRLYHPDFRDDGRPQPYVGIYDRQDVDRRRVGNTSLWLNTNIPVFKMVFSTFLQLIWLSDQRRLNGDELPSAYYGFDGVTREVDDAIRQKIEGGDVTWRHYHIYKEDYYERQPVSLTANMKLTKEFNSRVKAAGFVNNLFNVNPMYRNRYGQGTREWSKAFFGVEVSISFGE